MHCRDSPLLLLHCCLFTPYFQNHVSHSDRDPWSFTGLFPCSESQGLISNVPNSRGCGRMSCSDRARHDQWTNQQQFNHTASPPLGRADVAYTTIHGKNAIFIIRGDKSLVWETYDGDSQSAWLLLMCPPPPPRANRTIRTMPPSESANA